MDDDEHLVHQSWDSIYSLLKRSQSTYFFSISAMSWWNLYPCSILTAPKLLVQIFSKAIYNNGEGFRFFKRKLPKLSETTIKERVFQGPQIWQLMLNCDFKKSLIYLERQTWLPVKAVITIFLETRNPESTNTRWTLCFKIMYCFPFKNFFYPFIIRFVIFRKNVLHKKFQKPDVLRKNRGQIWI